MSLKSQEAMEAAWNDAESAESEPAEPIEAPEPVAAEAESIGAAPEEPQVVAQGQRERDPSSGKFLAKPKDVTPRPVAVKPTKPGQVVAEVPSQSAAQAQALKAPTGWSAGAREHWAKLPPAVQQEAIKRDKEAAVAVARATHTERQYQPLAQTLGQYQALLQGAGQPPHQVVGGLLQAAQTLGYGPMPHKAQLIAHLITSYGIDVPSVAAALDGKAMPQGQQQPYFDPNQFAQQIEQRIFGGLEQRQQRALETRSETEAEAFVNAQEFGQDVREDMADLLDAHARAGKPLTLEQAYSRALLINPTTAPIMQQREAAKRAEANAAKIQRSRVASSSIRGTPAPGGGEAAPMSRREVLEAAWDDAAAS